MKIFFLTEHDAAAPRKTGLYFMARHFIESGHEIFWVRLGQSRLSRLDAKDTPFNTWTDISPNLHRYHFVPPAHPVHTKIDALDHVLAPLWQTIYPRQTDISLRRALEGADIVLTNAGAGLMLIPLARNARRIYFASDRLDTLRAHPAIIAAERAALPHIDLLYLISQERRDDFPNTLKTIHLPQSIDRALFASPCANPYTGTRNAVCAGDMLFDADVLTLLAAQYQDWTFHLFGRHARMKNPRANIITHGETPFEDLVPFLKYADIGLAPYRAETGGSYFAQSSLKIAQYTALQLPVLAPDFLKDAPSHVLLYDRHDEASILSAFDRAMQFDRARIDADSIPDWKETAQRLLKAVTD